MKINLKNRGSIESLIRLEARLLKQRNRHKADETDSKLAKIREQVQELLDDKIRKNGN